MLKGSIIAFIKRAYKVFGEKKVSLKTLQLYYGKLSLFLLSEILQKGMFLVPKKHIVKSRNMKNIHLPPNPIK